MGKKQEYANGLAPLLKAFPGPRSLEAVETYLSERSNLPGPRANLELAEAFAEAVARLGEDSPTEAWKLCSTLAALPRSRAAQNTSGEFLAFCGVRGLGALGAVSDKFLGKAMEALKKNSRDDRWRMRESVAASIQKLLLTNPKEVLRELANWVEADGWLQMRAVVAAIAEPALMKDPRLADAGFRLQQKVLDKVLKGDDRDSEEFRALRKTLGYSLSVVAVAMPKESFDYMSRLVNSGDPDALWIVRENLKKDRLQRNFPNDVAAFGDLAKGSSAKQRT